MKIGFLFAGQGTQHVGMGKDLYEKYESAKFIYNKAHEITGIDIKNISFEGPEEDLNNMQNTQLAILAQSLAIVEILRENQITAEYSAGLSLGEYSALIDNGVFSLEDGIKIVSSRGKIMQDYTPEGNWKMAAILALDSNKVKEICDSVTSGFVRLANYNTIGNTIISGDEVAVIEATEKAREQGAKIRILNTRGPFHTEKLTKCSELLKIELDNLKINKNKLKVIKNIDGLPYNEKDDFSDILSKHVMSPVKFDECIKTMYENGVDTFIEIGPGKTLGGFVKRMKFEKELNIYNIENVETLENVLTKLNCEGMVN